MDDQDNKWPYFASGGTHHMHAIGIIASEYNALENIIFELAKHHPTEHGVPTSIIEFFYYSLNEQKRAESIKLIYSEYEKDQKVVDLIKNLIEYFNWSWDCRNKILHSEYLPPYLGGSNDHNTLSLQKRKNKRSSERAYMTVELGELREIAELIHECVNTCSHLLMYLRIRDTPSDLLTDAYLPYVGEPLPQKLDIPDPLPLIGNPRGD